MFSGNSDGSTTLWNCPWNERLLEPNPFAIGDSAVVFVVVVVVVVVVFLPEGSVCSEGIRTIPPHRGTVHLLDVISGESKVPVLCQEMSERSRCAVLESCTVPLSASLMCVCVLMCCTVSWLKDSLYNLYVYMHRVEHSA